LIASDATVEMLAGLLASAERRRPAASAIEKQADQGSPLAKRKL
jgi:hypothetical protein